MSDRLKREARERAAATGEPYTVARRAVARQEQPQDSPGAAAAAKTLLRIWDLARRAKASPGEVRQAERDHARQAEWEEEQEALHGYDDHAIREHKKLRFCAGCGEPARRMVRRWQVGRTLIAADAQDPARTPAGYVEGLSEPPDYTMQPRWAVCGTVCARKVIEDDQARPHKGSHVPGRAEFYYEVEPFRYLPHASELPDILVRLRAGMELLSYSREGIERAVLDCDMGSAAYHLEGLRRDIARTAVTLAQLETVTPSARRYPPGSPEPGIIQVKHGEVTYSNMSFLNFDRQARRDHWEGTDGTRHTWRELTELAGGDLTEIPREQLRIPREPGDDEDDFQPTELFWYDRHDPARPRPQLDDGADDY